MIKKVKKSNKIDPGTRKNSAVSASFPVGEAAKGNVFFLHEKGIACYNSGKIKDALEYFAIFKNSGKNLFKLAIRKRYETSIVDARPLFQDAESWFREAESWFVEGKEWMNKVRNVDQNGELTKAIKTEFADGLHYWGYALAYLARAEKESWDKKKKAGEEGNDIRQVKKSVGKTSAGKSGYDNARKLFLEAIEKNKMAIDWGWDFVQISYSNIGASFYRLSIIETVEGNIKKAKDYAVKAKKNYDCTERDIMGILVSMDRDVSEPLSDSNLLYDMLDGYRSEESRFFRKTIKGVSEDLVNVYKNVYIRSIFIINRLYVDNMYEMEMANYQKMSFSRELLFGNEKFKLRAVDYMNDPTEGKVLLDYLLGYIPMKTEPKKLYGAFVGCFTFNCNSLNQFRLYGKEDKEEGTGLSLVFHKDFFSKNVKLAMEQEKVRGGDDKLTLFRCIYFNPKGCVESVGQKEEYLFENKEEYGRYNTIIKNVINDVDRKLKELKDLVRENNLDPDVVGQLLINLRYLVKHSSFKEEQECRIMKICHLFGESDKLSVNDKFELQVKYDTNIIDYVKKIYFGPKVVSKGEFQDFLMYKGYGNIPCEWSYGDLA